MDEQKAERNRVPDFLSRLVPRVMARYGVAYLGGEEGINAVSELDVRFHADDEPWSESEPFRRHQTSILRDVNRYLDMTSLPAKAHAEGNSLEVCFEATAEQVEKYEEAQIAGAEDMVIDQLCEWLWGQQSELGMEPLNLARRLRALIHGRADSYAHLCKGIIFSFDEEYHLDCHFDDATVRALYTCLPEPKT